MAALTTTGSEIRVNNFQSDTKASKKLRPHARHTSTAENFSPVERQHSEQQLQEALRQLNVERTALQEANEALRGLMNRSTEEKKALRNSITANIDKVLMPTINALEANVSDQYRDTIAFIRKNLEEITSPFVNHISKKFMNLTAVETCICNMIRDGLNSKEIAEVRHVSPATVARQRERIRKKLGIVNSDVNLATYLRNFLHTSNDESSCGKRQK